MADFILIRHKQHFLTEASRVWNDYSPEREIPPISSPLRLPCMAAIFIVNDTVASTILDKKSAKRLVYPKTNKYRLGLYNFEWLESDLERKAKSYIEKTLKYCRGKDTLSQVKHIEEVMNKIIGLSGPILMSCLLPYNAADIKAYFFLVTRDIASTLVYYDKENRVVEEVVTSGVADAEALLEAACNPSPRRVPAYTSRTAVWEYSLNDTTIANRT